MSKYNYEFKKKIVIEYLSGQGSAVALAKKYGVPAKSRIQEWVKSYQSFGDEGLLRSRQKKNFSFEYKLRVIELYLSSEVSYQELALQEGINNPAMIAKWVNDFRHNGPDALRPKKKGRKTTMSSAKHTQNITSNEMASIDTSAEHVKQLENELLKLRIENAFLKELRRLRLEEETLLKKQRESSTASEENLN